MQGGFENFIQKVPNSFTLTVWYFSIGNGIEICFSPCIILLFQFQFLIDVMLTTVYKSDETSLSIRMILKIKDKGELINETSSFY